MYSPEFGSKALEFSSKGLEFGSKGLEFGSKVLETTFQPTNANYEHFTGENFSSGEAKENQYTSLNPIGANNKIESFSELLNGRYNYTGYEESGSFHGLEGGETSSNANERVAKSVANTTNGSTANGSEECDENFGEIIKKSIVETVSA